MQKSRTGKISIFSSLDAKLEFLAGRVESGWKCEQLDSISIRVQNVNSKLDSTISLLIITEYICLAFANVALQMKISSRLSISILMTWSASIWRRCESHSSFMFSWTSRTCTFNFNFIIEFSMRRLTVMSNLFDLRVKCVSLYFSEANVASWVQAHFAQTSCVQLSVLQIDSVILS